MYDDRTAYKYYDLATLITILFSVCAVSLPKKIKISNIPSSPTRYIFDLRTMVKMETETVRSLVINRVVSVYHLRRSIGK